jgi:hypothetical protein
VEWLIPVLWPIDLLNLPRRGPRPVLKPETRLTLKIMDDFGVPQVQQAYSEQPAPRDSYGYSQRPPANYYRPMVYATPPPPPPPPVTVLMFRNGRRTMATEYWFEPGSQFSYVALNGTPMVFPTEMLDLQATVAVNRTRGVDFTIHSAGY